MKFVYVAIAISLGVVSLKAQQKAVYLDDNQPIEARVKDALSRMTLEEKVKLCTAQSKFSSHGVPRLGIPEISMLLNAFSVKLSCWRFFISFRITFPVS